MSAPTLSSQTPDAGSMTCFVDAFPMDAIAFLNQVAVDSAAQAEVGGIQLADDTTARGIEHVRRSDVCWLKDTPQNRPIYELVARFVQQVNAQVFHLDLREFAEAFQLATYRSDNQGFYGWHVDIGSGRLANRKLSLIVPLTDPADYDGGEFQAFYDDEPTPIDLPLGRILAFPSYMLHRVTPVTRGVRRSLAIWVEGPPFK